MLPKFDETLTDREGRTVREKFYQCFEVVDGHWIWQKYKQHNYGGFYWDGERYPAHVASYALHLGELEEGDEVHHKCRIKMCVKPDCLERTNRQGNMAYERKEFCINNHRISEVGRTKSGNCKACMRDYLAAYYQAHK